MYKIVKWHGDERADIGDMEQSTGVLDLWETVRQHRTFHMPEGRDVGTTSTETRILGGFNIDLENDASIGGNGYCRLNQGSGFFKVVREGETKLGLLVGDEGEAYQILDFTAKSPGTDYAVWIRADYQDASSENRVFWNSGASAEYVDYVATREEITWEYEIRTWSAPSPGDEWVKIYKVPCVAGPAVGTVVDYRHFYFEGDAADSYAQEWGSGSGDRSSDRSTYGIQDMHDFVSTVRAQMAAMIDGSQWWATPAIHLSDLSQEHKSGGNHSDVVADSVRLNSTVAAAADSMWIDTTGAWMGALYPAFHVEDWAGEPNAYGIDTAGRPARGHFFFDNFTNHIPWTDKTTGVPDCWDVTAGGSGDVYASVSATGAPETMAKHGGVAVLKMTASATDSISLAGPRCWYLNTSNGIYLRAFFRVGLNSSASATRLERFGLSDPGAGYQFYFERDQPTRGDDHWYFVCNDLASTQVLDLGSIALGQFVNFYLGFKTPTKLHVHIPGYMLSPTEITTVSFAGCTGLCQPFILSSTNGTAAAHYCYVDQVEVWDSETLAGIYGNNAS
jgi:hypothetical protein